MTNNDPEKPAVPNVTAGGANSNTDDIPVLQTRGRRSAPGSSNTSEPSSGSDLDAAQARDVSSSPLAQEQHSPVPPQRLLLVEPSTTMRYVLKKYLSELGFDVVSLDDFKQALATLRTQFDEFDSGNEFVAVLFGWQSARDAVVERFLDQLESPDFHDLPVIALSQEMRAHSRAWVAGRQYTELVRWKDYRQVGVRLEYMLDTDLDEPASVAALTPERQQLCILVVDDSNSIRLALHDLLMSNGHDVTLASTHEEALQLALDNRFDLALLDYYLEESTGDTLCAELIAHKDTGDITCAILTGSFSDHIIKRCLSAGAIECMFKNESSELLLARITAIGRIVSQRAQALTQVQQLRSALSTLAADELVIDTGHNIAHIGERAAALLANDESTKPHRWFGEPLSSLLDGPELEHIVTPDKKAQVLNASIRRGMQVRQIAFQPIAIYQSHEHRGIDSIWKLSTQADKNRTETCESAGLLSDAVSDPLSDTGSRADSHAADVSLGIRVDQHENAPSNAVSGGSDEEYNSQSRALEDNDRAMAFVKNLDALLGSPIVDEPGKATDSTVTSASAQSSSTEWRNSLLLIELAYEEPDGRLKPVTADSSRLDEFLLAVRRQVSLETEVAYFGSSRIGFVMNHDTAATGLMHARLVMQKCNKLAVAAGFSSASCVGALARLDLHSNQNAETLLADLHRVLPKVASAGRNRLLLSDYERSLPVYPDGKH